MARTAGDWLRRSGRDARCADRPTARTDRELPRSLRRPRRHRRGGAPAAAERSCLPGALPRRAGGRAAARSRQPLRARAGFASSGAARRGAGEQKRRGWARPQPAGPAVRSAASLGGGRPLPVPPPSPARVTRLPGGREEATGPASGLPRLLGLAAEAAPSDLSGTAARAGHGLRGPAGSVTRAVNYIKQKNERTVESGLPHRGRLHPAQEPCGDSQGLLTTTNQRSSSLLLFKDCIILVSTALNTYATFST